MAYPNARLKKTALAVCALLAVAAGVMLGTRKDEPATQVVQPAAVPASHALVPRVPQADKPMPVVQVVESTTPSPTLSPPASPTFVAGDDSDIPQLRQRTLTLPVQGVTPAQLSDTYTQSRAAGAPHEAIDIMSARGTPVFAVEDGKVAKLFLSKPGGITIYQFDPGSQYAYYYAHLDRYADGLAEGASLRKGQVIGYVGSTGNASPDAPHLHFAIFKLGPEKQWWRGTPLNPYLVWRDPKP
ncbi:M23 family metallopeptidase [Polaromonas sp. YR568]|uniref:M23 family metallopeptidase n=1 Tax=Polaromonas sp. YR568 TaxID=1855301 RepID=UPI00398BE62F